ncbi:GNAT family N-acetyltransferase [Candidatus Margulisiibacteriota bacterium]
MIIRPEKPEDISEIRRINAEAFDADGEANLIDALRDSGVPLISLVAEDSEGAIIGHILFSEVTLDPNRTDITIAGLAPIAVLPAYQNKGVGSMLIDEGIKYCKKAGYAAVVVLGHHKYYPRFGFVPSTKYDLTCEYDVPTEVFMVKELWAGALKDCKGEIRYHEVFRQL